MHETYPSQFFYVWTKYKVILKISAVRVFQYLIYLFVYFIFLFLFIFFFFGGGGGGSGYLRNMISTYSTYSANYEIIKNTVAYQCEIAYFFSFR